MQKQDINLAKTSNEKTKSFLNYYCSTGRNFDYAVLINGKWGSGKTHFIKGFMNDFSIENGTSFIYVSLYGISSLRQIDEKIFKSLHPLLSSKAAKLAKSIAKGLIKATTRYDLNGDGKDDISISSQIPEIELIDHLEANSDNILVFDDIERCAMPFNEILGYINYFVEHRSIRAILLANEKEIDKHGEEDDSKRYKSVKEKLVGHIFEITPPDEMDLIILADSIKNKRAKSIVLKNFSEIYKIYVASELYNIRSLKKALRIFENLSDELQEIHWNNEEAIIILLKMIIALSFEANSGILVKNEIPQILIKSAYDFRINRKRDHELNSENTLSKYDKIKRKYEMVVFSSEVIKGETLASLLFDGWIDAPILINDLNQSRFYKPDTPPPAWRLAWKLWDLDDDTFSKFYKDIYDQFTNNEYNSIGEFLQICGLMLISADIGISLLSKEEIVNRLIENSNILFNSKKFSIFDVEAYNNSGGLFDSFTHEGYEVHNSKSPEFRRIWAHIESVSKDEYVKSIPDLASDLLIEMKEDSIGFFNSLCGNRENPSKFPNIPILSYIPTSKFISTLLSLEPESQRKIFLSLKERFDSFSPRQTNLDKPSWEREISWLSEINEKLSEEMNSMKPLSRYRFESYVRTSILPNIPITPPSPA
ncbi:P-loop NTPase fold protein [Azospirillum sp. A26]|uniref:P-loop NTPase fold protein n=1 Tax=Azospirillum sp. A26 TaxID=3160607 RepID=UPI00366ADB85